MGEQLVSQILFLGNPGSGKSTLLNGLIKQAKFRSGINYGSGLTEKIQWVEHNGVVYGDTPGLTDVTKKEQCAKEIENALKKGGSFKIVFVITLQEGRVIAQDVNTMNLIISAISVENVNYGIIVNKIRKRVMQAVSELNSSESRTIISCLNAVASSSRKPTNFIFYYPEDSQLIDEDNAVPNINTGIITFLQSLPVTTIRPEQVKAIDVNAYQRLQDEVAEKIARMEDLEKTITALQSDKIGFEEALQQQTLSHRKEIERHLAAHEERLADMQRQVANAQREAARKQRSHSNGGSGSSILPGVMLAGGITALGLFMGIPPFLL